MNRSARLSRVFVTAMAATSLVCLRASAGAPDHSTIGRGSYEAVVLPIFNKRCINCHGKTLPRAGLVLLTRQDLLQGGRSGPAIVPGSPEKSLLVKYLASGRMPVGGARLSSKEVMHVSEWISAGAPGLSGGGHWAFIPPIRPTIPRVRHGWLVRTPIDAFLLAALEKQGLSYSPEADRRTLIRRVTYDLIGLPPTPEDVAAFLADRSTGAYVRLVDRLLADARYGERWARHWLDAAGYADSEGVLQEDLIRPNAWRYRDYVVRSLNQDKPYDQFVREQIAGDELVDYRHAEHFTPAIADSLTATGFLRTAVDATRPDFNMHQFTEYQYRMLNDTETILATAVMGIPLQCARCHDHKYEPLSQRDYYRVQSLFAGAIRPLGTLLPSKTRQVVDAGSIEQKEAKEHNESVDAAIQQIVAKQDRLLREARLRSLSDHIDQAPDPVRHVLLEAARLDEAKRNPGQKELMAKYKALAEASAETLANAYPEFAATNNVLQKQRDAEDHKRVALPQIRALYDQDANPAPTHLLIRGDWSRPGEVVEPGIPAVLNCEDRPFRIPPITSAAQTTGRRSALARWLTQPRNPLTARVIVNSVWAHHFGIGIVPTVENLGRSGAQPTNQAVLDWLSAELQAPSIRVEEIAIMGACVPTPILPHFHTAIPWSLKALHRLIVTSSAYMQASRGEPRAAQVDPDDRLLWRQRQRRLEAEAIRDGMLAAAGNLDPTMYGEAVGLEARAGGDIVSAGEEKGGRRSIYLLVRRSMPVALLSAFDEPIMETNCTRRSMSTTPTQALALMNSSFVSAEADQFARRILREHPPSSTSNPADRAKITAAFQLAFSRDPSASESDRAMAFIRAQSDRYWRAAKDSAGRTKKESAAEALSAYADLCQALLSTNEFMYID